MGELSIIIPVYNAEEFLGKCLDSIVSQTLQDIEIICVNDGSTDNSLDVCNSYANADDRIKVINKVNGGSLSARKAGVSAATGDYIGFVDADDWVESDMYERLMNEATLYTADVVSCGYYLEENNSRRIVRDADEKKVIRDTEEREAFLEGALATGFDWVGNRNITPSVCNKVFRKSLLSHVYSKLNERILLEEDTVTVSAAVLDAECIVLIPDALYHYKIYMSSKSHRLNRDILQSYVHVFDELYCISKEHDGILDDQIPYFSLTAIRTAIEVGFGVKSGKQYMFPFGEIAPGSSIIIYGAGLVGRCYYNEVELVNYASQICITDSNPDNWTGVVVSPDDAFSRDYDIVLIAVENESTAKSIKSSLIERGVPEKKMFWEMPKIIKDTYSFYVRH